MREPSPGREPVFLLLLALFASVWTSGHFLYRGTLYWDNLETYSFYYDNFHSINSFGEPAYWAPSVANGYPAFYFSVIGPPNISSPAFALVGGLLWLLGRLGVQLRTFQPLFVLYTGFLFPALFCLALYALARQIFRSGAVVFYLVIVGAFSPAVVLNISDPGILDLAAYWLFFFAAGLAYLRSPGLRSFRVLALSLFVLAVSLSGCSPNLLPLFVAALFVPSRNYRRVRRAVAAVSLGRWLGALGLALVCALPNLLALRSSGQFSRTGVGSMEYGFGQLRAGNPLEPLTSSVPGVGFAWAQDRAGAGARPAQFLPQPVGEGEHSGYTYLGLLALPLAAFGLLFGRSWLRLRLLLLFIASFLVVVLAGYSPIFGPALVPPTPLRSYNHFGDLLYRGGGFLVPLIAAGAGLEAFLDKKGAPRRKLLGLWGVSVAFSVGCFLLVFRGCADRLGTIFGVLPLTAFGFSVLLITLARAGGAAVRRRLVAVLLFLVFVDVSTVALWHVRTLTYHIRPMELDLPAPDSVGLANERATSKAAGLLSVKSVGRLRAQGLPIAARRFQGAEGARGHVSRPPPLLPPRRCVEPAGRLRRDPRLGGRDRPYGATRRNVFRNASSFMR